jgi:predicted amidohydrolase
MLVTLYVGVAAPIRGAPSEPTAPRFVSRAYTPPRKVVIASVVAPFVGPVETRLRLLQRLLDEANRAAATEHGRGVDLMVFPEFALLHEGGHAAAEQAVALDGPVFDVLRGAARKYRTWLVVPMVLRESELPERFANAAVLFDRSGAVAGIYRKAFPVADERGVFEGGVAPGEEYPVFHCDFGALGILICWDMSYDEVWTALAAGGAEIVALPSASPQTVRPAAQALRHRYYVLTSTQRDNVTLLDPIGRTVAQVTDAPGVLVRQIDLSYAILHWSEDLHGGQALTERYGNRVGYDYSHREDTGVFWSNDPRLSIGEIIRAFGFREMPETIEHVRAARNRAR